MIAICSCSDVTAVEGVFLKADERRSRAEGEVVGFEDLLGDGRGGDYKCRDFAKV